MTVHEVDFIACKGTVMKEEALTLTQFQGLRAIIDVTYYVIREIFNTI